MIQYFLPISVFEWIMLGLLFMLLVLALVQIVPYNKGYKKQQAAALNTTNLPSVSVLICAHNEGTNLMNNLPVILEQKYPKFQVIVVNDASWDSTAEVVETFQKKYKNLHLVTIEETSHRKPGKKLPITIGMKAAEHDYILCTDADCTPISENWITEMVQPVLEGKQVVVGYSPCKKEIGFGKKFSRFDSLLTASTYLSWARAGVPYMGVGRNLLYSKKLFHQVGGFKKHYHITSGDDDLLVNMLSKTEKIGVVDSPGSIVVTQGQSSFARFFRQKKRHFTTGVRYRFGHKVLLSFPWFLSVFFGLSILVNIFVGNLIWAALSLVLYLIIRWGIWLSYGKKLKAKQEVILMPFYEILTLALYPAIWVAQKIRPLKGW